MSSYREAFENPNVAQGNFYSAQQIRYQQVEPNRFLPKELDPKLVDATKNNLLLNFNKYDPYTETTTNEFTLAGMEQLLKGSKEITNEEAYCRGLVGASALQNYRSEVESSDEIRSPIRCGWRYKKSPGGGAPLVSQGALGTINGPLNPKNDPLENGIEWIWDLRKASNRHAQDFVATLPASSGGLATAQTALGGTFSNAAYCSQTNKIIFIDQAGNPLPGYQCARGSIITDPKKFPQQTTQNPLTTLLAQNSSVLEKCSKPGNNPYLTRECLLQAVTNNGCSTDGALYKALQSGKASDTRYDNYLTTQKSFMTYQSRQGDNKMTEELFNREKGSWDMATQAIQKLSQTTQTSTDPVLKVAAQDLCLMAGKFDTYDFCSDLTDSTSMASVDLRCMQEYWQGKNGKPAGLSYPNTKELAPTLGKITTWGQYKSSVDKLRENTQSSDPLVQRNAVNNFLGVLTRTQPFTPLNLDDVDMQFRLGGQPLVFWLDAKDPSTFTIDTLNRVRGWRDKSQGAFNIVQMSIDNRPTYKRDAFPGVEFDGANDFMMLPQAQSLVLSNFIFFVVERRKAGGQNFFIAGSTPQTNRNLVLGYRGPTVATMAFLNNDLDCTVPAFNQSLEPVRMWAFEKTATGRKIYINGQVIKQDSNLSYLSSWEGASIGRYGNSFYNGTIYEMMIFVPGIEALSKRQKVEGYLAHKWGLANSLPANHPYKSAAP